MNSSDLHSNNFLGLTIAKVLWSDTGHRQYNKWAVLDRNGSTLSIHKTKKEAAETVYDLILEG